MVKRIQRKINNTGAALVMVIVCMLFIGIVSVAVLAMAMGNFGSTQTATKGSENFYTTETVADNLKVYLQQLANKAATDAYMTQLSTGDDDAAAFNVLFRTNLANTLSGKNEDYFKEKIQENTGVALSSEYEFNVDYLSDPNFVSQFIADGVLKNVEIKYTQEKTNYTTTISSDFEFTAVAPPLEYQNPDKKYLYDVDKYIFISGDDVNIGSSTSVGGDNTVIGNIYANGDIKVNASDSVSLAAENIIASDKREDKGSVKIVDGNNLSFTGFSEQFLDVKKDTYSVVSKTNGNVWCDDFNIQKGKITISSKVNLILGDDLTLEGDNIQFKVVNGTEPGDKGGIIAYSTDSRAEDEDDPINGTKATVHKNSGSIVINGKGTKLDLTNLNKLYLNGYAYTEVPDIAGEDNYNKYFVQGESLTYKSLQSIYLVDASKLIYTEDGVDKVVGSNPMPKALFDKWVATGRQTDFTVWPDGIDSDVANELKFTSKTVGYASGAEYVYVYWKFPNASFAANYFNSVNDPEVLKQKISAIGSGACINLPSDTSQIKTKGNLISYDGTDIVPMGKTADPISSSECSAHQIYYKNIKSSLSKDMYKNKDNLFDDVLFAGNKLSLVTTNEYDLVAPEQDGDFGCIWKNDGTGEIELNPEDATYKLILVNGDKTISDIDCRTNNEKYIVIATGKVTFENVHFKGIVFAKGGVDVVGSNNEFECLGNYQYVVSGEKMYKSEFEAILSVKYDKVPGDEDYDADVADDYKGNELLRKIFGVSDDDEEAGDDFSKYDFTSVNYVGFKKY